MNHKTLFFQLNLELWVPSYCGNEETNPKGVQKKWLHFSPKSNQTQHHPWNQRQASMTQLNELPFTKPWIPCGHRISCWQKKTMGFKVGTWWMSLRSRGWGYQWLTSDPRVQTCKKQLDIALLMLFPKDWREFQTFLISHPLRIRFVNLKSLEKFVAANKTQGSNFQQDLFAAKRLRQEPRQKGTCSLHLWLPNNAAVSNSPKADIHGILRRTRPQWKLRISQVSWNPTGGRSRELRVRDSLTRCALGMSFLGVSDGYQL